MQEVQMLYSVNDIQKGKKHSVLFQFGTYLAMIDFGVCTLAISIIYHIDIFICTRYYAKNITRGLK